MGIKQRFDRNYPCGIVGCPYRTATHWHEMNTATLEMVPLPINTQIPLESNIRRYELKPRFPYRFWTLLIVFVLLLVTKFSTI